MIAIDGRPLTISQNLSIVISTIPPKYPEMEPQTIPIRIFNNAQPNANTNDNLNDVRIVFK